MALTPKDQWVPAGQDVEGEVTLVSWNLLVRNSREPAVVASLSFPSLKRRGYYFRGNTWAPDEHRAWPHRQAQIERVLHACGGPHVDFYCLQESEEPLVDLPASVLETHALLSGSAAGGGRTQHAFTKPQLLYRKARWRMLWSESRTRVVLAAFEDLEHPQLPPLCVWSVHLTGGPSEAAVKERAQQIASALRNFRKHVKGRPAHVQLVCGDFNDTERFDTLEAEGLTDVLAQHGLEYPTHQWAHTGHPEYATSTIDHVYADASLRLVAVREPWTEEERREVATLGLPTAFHPSDHTPILARFARKQ